MSDADDLLEASRCVYVVENDRSVSDEGSAELFALASRLGAMASRRPQEQRVLDAARAWVRVIDGLEADHFQGADLIVAIHDLDRASTEETP